MRQAMRLLLVGTAIVGVRGRVTPGLCFDLRLSTQPESTGARSRYAINLGHQLEGIGPLLAAGVRQQPAAIVDVRGTPLVAMLLLAKSSYLVGNPASTFSVNMADIRRASGAAEASTTLRYGHYWDA